MSEKLQKVLARAGHGSRREIEAIIEAGRVSVDGKIATLGDRVEIVPGLKIRIDGHLISVKESAEQICRVLAYYKPEGELCTRNDPEGRPTVFDRLPKLRGARWIAVGRLDVNTCGLLLFTTDGELANRLMHPSREVEREYAVRVFGRVDENKLRDPSRGVQLEDGPAAFKTIKFTGGEGINQWYNVTLTEGRNREVRRLWEAVGVGEPFDSRPLWRHSAAERPATWRLYRAGSDANQLPARSGWPDARNHVESGGRERSSSHEGESDPPCGEASQPG